MNLQPVHSENAPRASNGSRTVLQGIPAALIPAAWPTVLPFIEKALAHSGRYTAESLYKGLLARELQLWVAEDWTPRAVCITEIRNYPAMRVGCVLLCSGEGVMDWLPHLPAIEAYLKAAGCVENDVFGRAEESGRTGWQKLLPGYHVRRVILTKEL